MIFARAHCVYDSRMFHIWKYRVSLSVKLSISKSWGWIARRHSIRNLSRSFAFLLCSFVLVILSKFKMIWFVKCEKKTYKVLSDLGKLGRLDRALVTASSWRVWIPTNGHQLAMEHRITKTTTFENMILFESENKILKNIYVFESVNMWL